MHKHKVNYINDQQKIYFNSPFKNRYNFMALLYISVFLILNMFRAEPTLCYNKTLKTILKINLSQLQLAYKMPCVQNPNGICSVADAAKAKLYLKLSIISSKIIKLFSESAQNIQTPVRTTPCGYSRVCAWLQIIAQDNPFKHHQTLLTMKGCCTHCQ